jgi:hypothetical protein
LRQETTTRPIEIGLRSRAARGAELEMVKES